MFGSVYDKSVAYLTTRGVTSSNPNSMVGGGGQITPRDAILSICLFGAPSPELWSLLWAHIVYHFLLTLRAKH